MAQFGDVFERRRWRKEREKRSGSDLSIGELRSKEDRDLVTTGRARGAQKLNNEVWLSLVERYVRDVEVASSNLVTSTISSIHNETELLL